MRKQLIFFCLLQLALLPVLLSCEKEQEEDNQRFLDLSGAQLIFATPESVHTIDASGKVGALTDHKSHEEYLRYSYRYILDIDQEYALVYQSEGHNWYGAELLEKKSGRLYSIASLGFLDEVIFYGASFFYSFSSFRSDDYLYLKGSNLVRVNLKNPNDSQQLNLEGDKVEDFAVDQQGNVLYIGVPRAALGYPDVVRYRKTDGSFAVVPLAEDSRAFDAVGFDDAGNFFASSFRLAHNSGAYIKIRKVDKAGAHLATEAIDAYPFVYGKPVKFAGQLRHVTVNAPMICTELGDNQPVQCYETDVYLYGDSFVDHYFTDFYSREGYAEVYVKTMSKILRHHIGTQDQALVFVAPEGRYISDFAYDYVRKQLLVSLMDISTGESELIAIDEKGNRRTLYQLSGEPIFSLTVL